MSNQDRATAMKTDIDDFLQELPPLNPALVQGNCNVAPLPHCETQGKITPPVETKSEPQ
jgi:hypothetical protein